VALLLAALGLYGVLSFLVTQRRQEIGTRMALGASKLDVLKVFMRQGLALTVAGLCVGIASALFVSRWLRSLLFGVTPTDPFSFAAVSLVLLAVASAASYLLRAGQRRLIRWQQSGLSNATRKVQKSIHIPTCARGRNGVRHGDDMGQLDLCPSTLLRAPRPFAFRQAQGRPERSRGTSAIEGW
jgi:hypothetical protein